MQSFLHAEKHVRFRNGKVEDRVETGDSIVIETGGGGGFGDPRERERDAVRNDVRRGYISADAAIRDYGLAPSEVDS